MVRVVVLYGHPEDPQHFDRHYAEEHLALAARIPNCTEAVWGHVATLDGSSPPYHLSAVLTFESLEVARASFSGPEAAAATADFENFATGGVTVLVQRDSGH